MCISNVFVAATSLGPTLLKHCHKGVLELSRVLLPGTLREDFRKALGAVGVERPSVEFFSEG